MPRICPFSFLLPSPTKEMNSRNERVITRANLDSSLFFRGTEGGRREGGKTDAAGHAAAREERATRSGLDGKDSRWVGRSFEGPQRNKRGREKRLARPRNNCDIMIQIPFDVLTRRTAHAGGGRGGRRTQQFVVRVQNT